MEKGGFVAPEGGPVRDYGGGVTFSVVVTCLMAAFCGLIFGYDIGISGACSDDSLIGSPLYHVLDGHIDHV
jgi:hypothetical protein